MRRILALLTASLFLPACGINGGGTLSPTVAPASPSQVAAAPGNRSVTLTWKTSSAGASYSVWRAFSAGGPFVPITDEAAFLDATSYADNDLTNGTTYYYQVKAWNSFGESAGSEVAAATPGFKATAIAASGVSAMALLPDRTVWCWGQTNLDDSLQAVAIDLSDVPSQVSGLRGVAAISTAPGCSMALLGDGSVWWWGALIDSRPARVPDVAGVLAVSAGGYRGVITDPYGLSARLVLLPFGLSLASDGTVWAWGDNTRGQLGNGTSTPISDTSQLGSVPAPVQGLPKVTAVSAGGGFCLALAEDGTLWSWGDNSSGQLGIGSKSPNPVVLPVRIPNFTEVIGISAGPSGALALRADGTVWAWGDNLSGQLGNGSAGSTPTTTPGPVQLPAGVTAKAVAMGDRHALALGDDGTLWSWGANQSGELGNGAASAPVTRPVRTVTVAGVVELAAGSSFSLATLADGTVYAWGDNTNGAIGVGTGRVHTTATPVSNLTDAVGIAAGDSFAAAARLDGSIWTWGSNLYGELGTGATGQARVLPAPVPGLSGFKAVAASGSTGLGLHSTGTVWAWGANGSGQLGNGKVDGSPAPVQIAGLTGVTSVVAGKTCFAVCGDGSLWGWGANQSGEVGNGSSGAPVTKPVRVTGLSSVVEVASETGFALAVLEDGTVWSWGSNSLGQLGRGTGSGSGTPTPVLVPGISGATAVATASITGFALLEDRTFWVWGQNHALHGDGFISTQAAALAHNLLFTGIQTLSASELWACAIRTDGTAWAWGYNDAGQLGNGVVSVQPVGTPARIRNLPEATAIAAGGNFGLALVGDKVWGWGENLSSQLGRPYVDHYATPVVISR